MFTQAKLFTAGLLIVMVVHGTGCRSYAPKPVDLAAHHEAWLSRTFDNADAAALAAAIRDDGLSAFGSRHATKEPGQLPTADSRQPISLRQAELVALVYNAELRLARARAGVTQATFDHAGLWDDPVLSIIPERVLSSGPPPWNVAASVGFTLPISGRLEVEKRRAGAAHHAAMHAVAEQEWQVRMDVRRVWIEWSAAALKRDVTADFLDRLDAIVNIITRMQEIGELAPVQARLFLIEQLQRRNGARALDATLSDRAIALRRLMGLAPDAPFEARPELAVEADAAVDDLAARIRARHPRILTLLAEYETAERALELAIRRQYPDVEIGPGYNRDEGTNRVFLGVSLPLPIFNQNRQAIAEADAERDRARAVLETAYERLLSDLAAATVQHEAASEQFQRMVDQIVPLVDQQYADARRIAELGEVDTLLLLDTLRRQYEAKLELIDLEARRSLASVRMIELLGPNETDSAFVGEGLLHNAEAPNS